MAGDLEAMTDLIDTALAFARGTTVTQHMALVDVAERSAVDQGMTPPAVAEEALVLGDPLALRRILGNFVDDAVTFGQGRVVLGVEGGDTHHRVTVDGPDLAGHEQAAIFGAFDRTEASRDRRAGGSGLATVRQIAEAHGGSILVGDGPLSGARFTIALP